MWCHISQRPHSSRRPVTGSGVTRVARGRATSVRPRARRGSARRPRAGASGCRRRRRPAGRTAPAATPAMATLAVGVPRRGRSPRGGVGHLQGVLVVGRRVRPEGRRGRRRRRGGLRLAPGHPQRRVVRAHTVGGPTVVQRLRHHRRRRRRPAPGRADQRAADLVVADTHVTGVALLPGPRRRTGGRVRVDDVARGARGRGLCADLRDDPPDRPGGLRRTRDGGGSAPPTRSSATRPSPVRRSSGRSGPRPRAAGGR